MGSQSTLMALAGLFSIMLPVSVLTATTCQYQQELIMGQEYYIFNEEYPQNNTRSCTWYGISQTGTRIVTVCDVSLPSSTNCVGDKLAISLSGDILFSDAKNYCGTGSVSLVTNGNSLRVGLFASYFAGNFICTLTAIKNPDATTPVTPSICDCGWKQGMRIVGGNETLINEFPSMAGLVDSSVRDVICGGSIISTRYVLTAAHCLLNVRMDNLGVLVGDHNISSGFDTVAAALYKVNAYEMHPKFNSSSLINDLAILRTTKEILFGLYVGPACLPFRFTTSDFVGQTVTALGWGQIFFTGPKSDVLQKVDLTVTTNNFCAQENPGSEVIPGEICTFANGKDACQSDSGGPLLWMDTSKRRMQLVGVISHGLGCATDRPGMNTRITSYISWIVSRTPDANYCIK